MENRYIGTQLLLLHAKLTLTSLLLFLFLPSANSQSTSKGNDGHKMIQNLHATNASPINSKSIENMDHNWHYATEHPVSHAPLVKDDAVYFGDWGGTIYKVDAKKGSLIWKKNIENAIRYVFINIGLLLNRIRFNNYNIAGHRGMDVHIHENPEEIVRRFLIFLGTVIVMMVFAGMCHIRMRV